MSGQNIAAQVARTNMALAKARALRQEEAAEALESALTPPLTTITRVVQEWFVSIVYRELSTLEKRIEPLAKAEMFDVQLANEIGEAYAHLAAARRRAAELTDVQA